MSDEAEYIEEYFARRLSDTEKMRFEQRCVTDEDFAVQVAFYISTREAARQKLLEQKKQQWAKENTEDEVIVMTSSKKRIRKWLPYIAAACLILLIEVFFLFRSQTPSQLAKNYTNEQLMQLSQTMDGSADSLQQGIAAYNNKDYQTALLLFQKVYQSHPQNSEAKKYAGFVYLVTKDYDKALQQFEELSDIKNLYSNPGMFLKATTLLDRNKKGDKEQAKILLERVVNEKAEGNEEAEKWLQKF